MVKSEFVSVTFTSSSSMSKLNIGHNYILLSSIDVVLVDHHITIDLCGKCMVDTGNPKESEVK